MFILVLLLFLFVGGIFAVVTVENLTTTAHLIIFGRQISDVPIGLLVVFSFLLGALLLYVVSFLSAWSDKRELKRLHKRIEELEKQQIVPQKAVNGSPLSPPPPTNSTLQMPGMFIPPKY